MGKPEEWGGTARLIKAFETDVLRMTDLLARALRRALGPHSSTRLSLARGRDPAKNQQLT